MKISLIGLSLIALFSCFFLSRPVSDVELVAQAAATGSISGTISDTSGAVVSGASVTAINDATNQGYSVTTDSSGYFSLNKLPVGTYTVRVGVTGFKTLQQSGVVVSAGQASQLNIHLFVGAAPQLGEIKIKVRNSRDVAVGVAITIVAITDAGATTTGMSDSNGEYLYSNASAGAYLIKAAGKDGKSAQQRIQLKSGQKKQIQLKLR